MKKLMAIFMIIGLFTSCNRKAESVPSVSNEQGGIPIGFETLQTKDKSGVSLGSISFVVFAAYHPTEQKQYEYRRSIDSSIAVKGQKLLDENQLDSVYVYDSNKGGTPPLNSDIQFFKNGQRL